MGQGMCQGRFCVYSNSLFERRRAFVVVFLMTLSSCNIITSHAAKVPKRTDEKTKDQSINIDGTRREQGQNEYGSVIICVCVFFIFFFIDAFIKL